MDSKSTSRRRRRRTTGISRGLNTMMLRSTWTSTAMQTGTTGTMSSWTSPSITHSSEYSVMQSLFTEVKLVACRFILTPTQAVNNSVLQGVVVVSTNMLLNENSGADPTSFSDVQNQTHPVRFSTSSVRPLTYRMPVPSDLEYSSVTNDAPATQTPYAGSPGIIRWYSTGLTASTVYFQLHVEAIHAFRGRQ